MVNAKLPVRPRVFVAGATGYLGRHFLGAKKSGCDVIPIVRDATQLGIAERARALTMGELHKTGRPGTGGAALVHLIGSGRETEVNGIFRANVQATETLLAAAETLGVDRIVYVSGFGISHATASVYYRSKHEAEERIRTSGLSHAIVRCSYVVGDDDELIPRILREARRGVVRVPGHGGYRIQPVHVHDVVQVLWSLVTTSRATEGTFDLLGSAVTFLQFVKDIALLSGVEASFETVDLVEVVQDAVRSADPWLSLSELGILCADRVGAPTRSLGGVRIAPYREILDRIASCLAEGGQHSADTNA